MPTLLGILDSWLNLAQIFQYKLLLFLNVLSLHGQLLLDLLGGHLPLLSLLLVFNLHHTTNNVTQGLADQCKFERSILIGSNIE